MNKRVTGVVGTVLLAIAFAAFTGSALAGNGNGSAPPGQAKKSSSSSTGSASQGSTAQPGTKPASTTQKDTTCATGGGTGSSATCSMSGSSKPDNSKRYGNGTTAAQIANSRGAPAGTLIKGPGNSQPHKVCGKNGHYVDVHAVKSYTSTCVSSSSSKPSSHRTSSSHQKTTTVTTTTVKATVSTVAPVAVGGMAGAAATTSVSGQVLGARAAPRAQSVHGGVLGAVAAKRTGKLPFTGFPVWLGLLAGLALTGAGLGLRRFAGATV